MARNLHENASIKQSLQNTYGAEAAYQQAKRLAEQSIK